MTHENRYKAICYMIHAYDQAAGNQAANSVINHPEQWVKTSLDPFYASAAALLIEAKEGMETRTTDRTTLAAIKRFYKSTLDMPNTSFHGIVNVEAADGSPRYMICDGHRILSLKNDISCIPHVDQNHSPNTKVLNSYMENSSQCGDPLPLPSVSELKAFIAENKAAGNDRKPFCIDGFIWVSPQYLIDMIQALPGCTAIRPARNIDPIYFGAETGEGLLLPVNPKSIPHENAA